MTHPLVGQVLDGKYRVESVLGEGGMGVVLAATHELLGEQVAVKVLSHEMCGRADVLARFQREARAAARINNEHVARVLDFGVTDGVPYLVMERLRGQDLEQLLSERGRLPVGEAVNFVLQACEALSVAHELGIVHRDLKPANLFLARRPRGAPILKILDFGISKMQDDRANTTKTSSIFGSPAYMSPEQLRSTRDVDARSDVWSLGVVLFELCAGETPFGGESLADISANILRSEPLRLSEVATGVPDDFSDIVAACLRREPAERVASVDELARLLAPYATPVDDASWGGPASRVPTSQASRASSETASAPTMLPDGAAVSSQPLTTPEPSRTSVARAASAGRDGSGTHATVTLPSEPALVARPTRRSGFLAVGLGAALLLLAAFAITSGRMSGQPSGAAKAEPSSTDSPKASATVELDPKPTAVVAASVGSIEPATSEPSAKTLPSDPQAKARPSTKVAVVADSPSAVPNESAAPVARPASASIPDFGGRK